MKKQLLKNGGPLLIVSRYIVETLTCMDIFYPESLADAVRRLQEMKQQLTKAENDYQVALLEDKEFVVLKALKIEIKDLKQKVTLFSESIDNRIDIN